MNFDDDEAVGRYVGRILEPMGFGELHTNQEGADKQGLRWKEYTVWAKESDRQYLLRTVDDEPEGFRRMAMLEYQCRQIVQRELETLIAELNQEYRRTRK